MADGSPGLISDSFRELSPVAEYSFRRCEEALFGGRLRFPLVPNLLSDLLHLTLVVAWLVVENNACSSNCLSGLILQDKLHLEVIAAPC